MIELPASRPQALVKADRSKTIGGSDVASIVGLDPYRSAFELFLEKTGRVERPPANESMVWGTELEPIIIRLWAQGRGPTLRPVAAHLELAHPDFPFLVGHLDGRVEHEVPEDEEVHLDVVEAKSATYADGWGEPGSDDVPTNYYIQGAFYAGLAAAVHVVYPVLFMAPVRRGAEYMTTPPRKLYEALVEAAVAFKHDNLDKDVAPSITKTTGKTQSYIRQLFPEALEPVRPAVPEEAAVVERLFDAEAVLDKATEEFELLKALLQTAMGSASGLRAGRLIASWSGSKSTRVNMERLKEEAPDLAKEIEKFKESKPIRVFRLKRSKE